MVLAATCRAAQAHETGRRGGRLSPRVPHAKSEDALQICILVTASQELKEIGYGHQ